MVMLRSIMPASSRCGLAFTLIEMLVVVTIIAILMGLLIPAIGLMQGSSDRVKTKSLLSMVAQGMAASGVEKATNIATVEHPLAASALVAADAPFAEAPRAVFFRSADNGGGQLPATGYLIRTTLNSGEQAANSWSTADQDRVMRRSDIYGDAAAPQFVGLPRWQIQQITVATPWVTAWERVNRGAPPGTIEEAELSTWVDEGFVKAVITDRADTAWEENASNAFTVALESVLDELINLGAVAEPDPTTDGLIHYGRLRAITPEQGAATAGRWLPGMVDDEYGGTWKAYRIRGPCIIDAWGREVLISRSETGAFFLQSAAADGSFKWLPGPNGVLDTTGADTAIQGDDLDGSLDNIFVGEGD